MIRIRSRVSLGCFLALLILFIVPACGGGDDDTASPTAPSANVPFSQTDIRVGTGAEAVAGRALTVHYTLWLYDTGAAENKGRMVQSSVGSTPFRFVLGTGQVIRGWDQGVAGMRVGGQRRLILPPDLAYGASGNASGGIPPNATLIFEIELLEVS